MSGASRTARRRHLAGVAVLALPVVLGMTGCTQDDPVQPASNVARTTPPATSAPPPEPDPDPDGQVVKLTFQDDPGSDGVHTTLVNEGSDDLDTSILTLKGGTLKEANGRGVGSDNVAGRFPEHRPRAGAPRAVIRVANNGPTDLLNPGLKRLEFGADFKINAVTRSDGMVDNGDNMIQRGRHGDRSQYKIELDRGKVACQVVGTGGDVRVVSSVDVRPGPWYRAVCTRESTGLTLTVTAWIDGETQVDTRSETGATGDLTPEDPSVPLSVGGKLDSDGEIEESTDQFNGVVDNVYVTIG